LERGETSKFLNDLLWIGQIVVFLHGFGLVGKKDSRLEDHLVSRLNRLNLMDDFGSFQLGESFCIKSLELNTFKIFWEVFQEISSVAPLYLFTEDLGMAIPRSFCIQNVLDLVFLLSSFH